MAVSVHVPVPLVMVTVLPVIEHAPPAVNVGDVLALVVEATVKVDWNAALAGAPVKVTVGAICGAVVDCVAVAGN